MAPIVHHLNLGRITPPARWLLGGDFAHHCLLLEWPDRLALVDTGFSSLSGTDPERAATMGRPTPPELAAVNQLPALGFEPSDVTDIVLTHLDPDHVGALHEFPQARVHLSMQQYGLVHHPTRATRWRLHEVNWRHGPRWTPAELSTAWSGRPAAELDGLPGVFLVDLPGHMDGHCGVAIAKDASWLLHAGDAVYRLASIAGRAPLGIRAMAALIATDRRAQRATLRWLGNLADDVEVICSHDPAAFPDR